MKHGIRSLGALAAAGAFMVVAVAAGPASAAKPVPLLGDVNKDGVVNCTDADLIGASFTWGPAKLKTREARAADLNNDSAVNVLDLSIVISHWTAGEPTTCA